MSDHDFDVLIVGAGLSGIGAAYHLQTNCPGKSYAILEAREALGGTWDLHRYPGIRSDSDMYTLGYSFRPWTNPKSIADGPSILAYVRETAELFGIDRKIQYHRKVERARWSSVDRKWTLSVRDTATGELEEYTCRFVIACAGYYDYTAGYTPDFPGIGDFKGRVVHPQTWTDDIDYAGKRVVVIGSGATAVTLVPEMAKRAAHVTMLQRSPTYYMIGPDRDPVADFLRARVSPEAAYSVTRWKNVLLFMAFYNYTRKFPESAKKLMVGLVRRQLGSFPDFEKHFVPKYKVWDQRVCYVPKGDLFEAIREGRASVVTDHIERFTENGIRLKSGEELPADLVVTATGFTLKLFGGIALEVDGAVKEPRDIMLYKGMMCSDVPNLTFAIGYTNASWTLKCDLTSEYACRLINYMDQHGYAQCTPKIRDADVHDAPLLDFTSGYVQRSAANVPKQGSKAPWKLYQNYALDHVALKRGKLDDGTMEFVR